jgi:hypothetical protein
MPIATIITDRRRVRLAGRDRKARIELSDDHVSSIVGLRRGPSFRQIEIEADSPQADKLTDEASGALIRAGAVPTDATKLEVVLGSTPEPESLFRVGAPTSRSRCRAVRDRIGCRADRRERPRSEDRLGSRSGCAMS